MLCPSSLQNLSQLSRSRSDSAKKQTLQPGENQLYSRSRQNSTVQLAGKKTVDNPIHERRSRSRQPSALVNDIQTSCSQDNLREERIDELYGRRSRQPSSTMLAHDIRNSRSREASNERIAQVQKISELLYKNNHYRNLSVEKIMAQKNSSLLDPFLSTTRNRQPSVDPSSRTRTREPSAEKIKRIVEKVQMGESFKDAKKTKKIKSNVLKDMKYTAVQVMFIATICLVIGVMIPVFFGSRNSILS